jgi:hypothetical protein
MSLASRVDAGDAPSVVVARSQREVDHSRSERRIVDFAKAIRRGESRPRNRAGAWQAASPLD